MPSSSQDLMIRNGAMITESLRVLEAVLRQDLAEADRLLDAMAEVDRSILAVCAEQAAERARPLHRCRDCDRYVPADARCVTTYDVTEGGRMVGRYTVCRCRPCWETADENPNPPGLRAVR